MLRNLGLCCLLFHLGFALHRLLWLFFHWKTFAIYHVEQGIICAALTCFASVFISLLIMQKHHYTILLEITNQINLLLVKSSSKLTIYPIKIPGLGVMSLQELFVKTFSLAIFLFPPAPLVVPFTIDWDPYELLLGPSIPVTILGGFLLAFTTYSGAMPMLSVFLLLMAFLEGVHTFTIPFNDNCSTVHRFRFRRDVKIFQMVRILVNLTDEAFTLFLTTLVFIGVLLASTTAFIILKMYMMVNIITYIGALAGLFVCLAVAIVLTYLANLPRKSMFNFVRLWTILCNQKYDKRMLMACKPAGFSVGPYGIATSKLGICICDDILHNTVTMLLVGII